MVSIWDAFEEKNNDFCFWALSTDKSAVNQFWPRKDPDLLPTKCEPVDPLVNWGWLQEYATIKRHCMDPNDLTKITNHRSKCSEAKPYCQLNINPFTQIVWSWLATEWGNHFRDTIGFFLDLEGSYLTESNLVWTPNAVWMTLELTGSHLVGSHLVRDFT